MDLSSMWITNCDLIEKMTETEYAAKEAEIMELFGGPKNMMAIILKHKHNLSQLQHHQLSNVLQKPIPKDIDSDKKDENENNENYQEEITTDNQNDEKDPILLTNLNENCLSNICQFLQVYEREYLGLTTRWLYKVSKLKSSALNLNITFSIHRLHYFLNELYQVEDLSNFISLCESLFLWINIATNINDKEELKKRKTAMSKVICNSGLLPKFSELLVHTQIIKNHPKLIKNILFLFVIISEFSEYIYFALNSNIIEKLNILMQVHTCTNVFLSDIVIILNNFFNMDDHTFIPNRLCQTSLIRQISNKLANKSALNLKISTMQTGLKVVTYWLDQREFNDCPDITLDTIIAQCIDKVHDLIDFENEKWIYELEKGDDVMIINNDNQSIISLFRIQQITDIQPPKDDINPMITLLGKYYVNSITTAHNQDVIREMKQNGIGFGPYQQIIIPFYRVKCAKTDLHYWTTNYSKILNLFQTICELMVSFGSTSQVNYDSIEYQNITHKIKHILQVSQTQMSSWERHEILLNLLRANWTFFSHFLSEEIGTEFIPGEFPPEYSIFSLLTEAPTWKDFDDLCALNWFKEIYYSLHSLPYGIFRSGRQAARDEYLLLTLLKNFHNDYQSYLTLCIQLETITYDNGHEYKGWDHQYFIQRGVYYLLQIMKTVLDNANMFTPEQISKILKTCRNVLADMFIHFDLNDCIFFRKEFLKVTEQTNVENITTVLKKIWWCVLVKGVFTNNRFNDSRREITKSIIHEMDWFIHKFNLGSAWFHQDIFTGETRELRAVFEELHAMHTFTDNNTISALQNVISVI